MTFRTFWCTFLRCLEHRGTFLILAIITRIILEIGYLVYVNPVHSYSGFVLTPDPLKYFESWVIFLIIATLSPHRVAKPSDFFLAILLFGLMTPLLSYYALADQPRQHLYSVILGFILIDLFRRGRPLRILTMKEGPLIALVLLLSGAVGISAWYFFSGGIFFFNLKLKDVYQFRSAVGSVINTGVMSYVNIWAWKVFGPALLSMALWRKKYLPAVLLIGLHVFWFGISAHKAVLFYPLMVGFIWICLRGTRGLGVVPLAISGIVAVAILFYIVLESGLPASLFIRRAFYVIANNTFSYYEFFSENPRVWWSNSLVSLNLLEYPYDINPALLIGKWRGTKAHVNNTFLSTGYMHAGLYGIILYGVLTGLLLRLIDSLASKRVPLFVALGIMVVPCISLLLSADFPTALLTHGIGVGILILFLMGKPFKRSSIGKEAIASK